MIHFGKGFLRGKTKSQTDVSQRGDMKGIDQEWYFRKRQIREKAENGYTY